MINAYNQNNYPEKAITQISKIKSQNPQDAELLLEETFSYSAINQKDKAEKLLSNLIKYKLPEEIEKRHIIIFLGIISEKMICRQDFNISLRQEK